jgi:hypothetical protein
MNTAGHAICLIVAVHVVTLESSPRKRSDDELDVVGRSMGGPPSSCKQPRNQGGIGSSVLNLWHRSYL